MLAPMFSGVASDEDRGHAWRRQQVQAAAVMDDEALQKIRIQTIRVRGQIAKRVLIFEDAQVELGVPERGMQVHQECAPRMGPRQYRPQVRGHHGHAHASFGSYQCHHPPGALALFSPPRNPRDRLKQLLARNRLQQIFAASAAHRLDDQLRLRIAGDRENRYLRKAGVDFLRRHSGAVSIAVKVDEADVAGSASRPLRRQLPVFHEIVAQLVL